MKQGTKIQWIDRMSILFYKNVQGMFPDDFDPSDFDREQSGYVIGVTRDFFGTIYLTVCCDDSKIRTVEQSKVTVIPDKPKELKNKEE